MPDNGDKLPKELELAEPIDIRTVGSVQIEIDPSELARHTPGAFTFADGTTEGWTLDQMYDCDTEPPVLMKAFPSAPPANSVFTLSNYFGLGLAAEAKFLIGWKSAKMLGFAFVSPDLTGRPGWTTGSGVEIDLYRDYFSWFNNPNLHLVQLQADFKIKDGTTKRVVEENKAGAAAYNETKQHQDYHFKWTAPEFADANHELKRIRVFCKLINMAAQGIGLAVHSGGDWRITNVRPVP